MKAPYDNLRDILARAEMTVVDRPVANRVTSASVGAAMAEALLTNPGGAIHFDATASVAHGRRRAANEHLEAIGDAHMVSIVRLDPRAPGGAGRTSPWEATLVVAMKHNNKEARQ